LNYWWTECHISGHRSILEANAEKSWLADEESKVLVDFLIKEVLWDMEL